ncbi:prepilin-type N-terminal cleavage/methylation domain-containing protein [Ferrimonas senticii]|uniref:prepilin-type N-terminal cleavage/methylation domain-containing protein n=1 Tax=Ferrimonas senticii TaxID=394566 RepID=UPI000481C677|nr:prepilin-type N-terminal cleavage/methylation domain-containing protein [Ferrimonas senticii]
MKTKQQGFTFVELVIVVVVLGLLAAVALPRFINLTDEAEVASAEGVAGGFASAVGLVRGQWEVDGRPAGEVAIDGITVDVNGNGYPDGNSGVDERQQCALAMTQSLSSSPKLTTADTFADGDRFVVWGEGAGADRLCTYVQLYSLGLEQGDEVPATADAVEAGRSYVGFEYRPETGQVTTFSRTN